MLGLHTFDDELDDGLDDELASEGSEISFTFSLSLSTDIIIRFFLIGLMITTSSLFSTWHSSSLSVVADAPGHFFISPRKQYVAKVPGLLSPPAKLYFKF
jgi:hypothetical protein